MKIAFVITGLGVGGAEKVVTSLADALVQKGHEVIIVYLTGSALVLPVNPDIRIIDLEVNSIKGMIFAYFKLRQILLDFKPDVVHSHMVHANILTRLLRLTVPMPRLISTAHNVNEGGSLRMLFYRLTDRLTNISTNVSQEAVDSFIEQKAVKPGRMIAVHNGIDTNLFSCCKDERMALRNEMGLDENIRVLLAVGSFTEQKDYPNLLNAFASISSSGIDAYLLIVGDGPLRSDIEALAATLGIIDKVRFLGLRHDVPALMSGCDVFVLSSAWEGFGLVVAEAMACERVVVATDCGGVREVVGDAGFLVPPRDSDKLSRALTEALELPEEDRMRLGLLARERVESFYSMDAALEKWSRLYQQTLPC